MKICKTKIIINSKKSNTYKYYMFNFLRKTSYNDK